MKEGVFIWLLKLIVAAVLLQTLYFKFSAATESVYIFSKLGMEPFGRIGIGILELIAAVLIVIPRLSFYGALLGLGIMTAAIFSHLFILGVEVMGDGGMLFALALLVFVSCFVLIYKDRHTLFHIFNLK